MNLVSGDRRTFLRTVSAVAGAAAVAGLPLDHAMAGPGMPRGNPFTLGVASGDPDHRSVVLWTRLVPDPLAPDGGMPRRGTAVEWQVAADSRFRRVVRSGSVRAVPALAHSVHAEVRGLAPDREWWYRFRWNGRLSPVGRTRTAPAPGADVERLDFAFASCQNYADGYWPSYRQIAEDDLDLVVFLGDYVYEGTMAARGRERDVAIPEVYRGDTQTLRDWRLRYTLYKQDPDLQRAHARFPWLVTWDDHEAVNDYAGEQSQYGDGDISAKRAAAYQAWYEHQPVRIASRPVDGGARIYKRLRWGRLAQVDLVDGRQYRDVPPCGWGEAPACDAAYAPGVSMLGAEQERWLYDGLRRSRAQWDVLASNVMVARLDHDGPSGDRLWHDAWDGFPAARQRLIGAWKDAGTRNPVVITGDWHSTFVNDVLANHDRPESPVVATEFVGTSVSSNGDRTPYGPYYGPMITFNPHIQFFDGDRRGHVRCTVDREQFRSDLQMVRTVTRRDPERYTYASFAVQDGVPGAMKV
ncbi:alkaline phosphatase D family protein [Nocardioides sp. AX2bis]|uniref:alkaline phosphatase D family protein n=1 Tax=Nocardioides sp. AX2bis TaxID=2653157 RepID=UPI0012F22424|nr:alkaline phosphatase D family protein [Nocardioides sp. AX2bis]VXC29254.1 Alkaline phosphatase D [Nocardioides sp. AX2bis]